MTEAPVSLDAVPMFVLFLIGSYDDPAAPGRRNQHSGCHAGHNEFVFGTVLPVPGQSRTRIAR